MSSNARKGTGGNTRRLICRERGDVRGELLARLAALEAAFITCHACGSTDAWGCSILCGSGDANEFDGLLPIRSVGVA